MRVVAIACALVLAAALPGRAAPEPARESGTDISVRNIDYVIRRLNELARSGNNKQAAQSALVLNLLKGMGRAEPGEAGRGRLDYHLEVAGDGHILVNSQDLSALIALAGGHWPR